MLFRRSPPERLKEVNGTIATYLAKKLGVTVEFVPVADYPAAVSLLARRSLR